MAVTGGPGSLTFFKDYTHGGSLDADYSVGSPTATFTNTSNNTPVFSNGISITTARTDVLKYAISGNRTAAQETIIIKFTPDSNFANDGVGRKITSCNTLTRMLDKSTTGTVVRFDENGSRIAASTTNIMLNTSYVVTGVLKQAGNHNKEIFINGTSEGSEDTDFTDTLGNYFYLGTDTGGGATLNGLIQKVAIFNRALSESEVQSVTNILNS